MTLDPKFVVNIVRARDEGNAERLREHQASCDRGAKALQEMIDDPKYQSKILKATRSDAGKNYCESIWQTQGEDDIRNCLGNKNHTECRRLSNLLYIYDYGTTHNLCFNSSKLLQ